MLTLNIEAGMARPFPRLMPDLPGANLLRYLTIHQHPPGVGDRPLGLSSVRSDGQGQANSASAVLKFPVFLGSCWYLGQGAVVSRPLLSTMMASTVPVVEAV